MRSSAPPGKLGPDGKPQGGTPPPGYVCYRCRQPGHFIQHCPNLSVADGGDEGTAAVRRAPVGIPMRNLQKIAASSDADIAGGFLMADGSIARMVADERMFSKATSKSHEKVDAEAVPEELKCPITKKLFRDPVVLPCCGASVSGDAVLQALIDDPSSDGTTCALCGTTGVKVDEVIPNKQMRDALKAFFEDVKHAKGDATTAEGETASEAGDVGSDALDCHSSGACTGGAAATLTGAGVHEHQMGSCGMGAGGLGMGAGTYTNAAGGGLLGGSMYGPGACGRGGMMCGPGMLIAGTGAIQPQRPGDWICPNCAANCYVSRMTCFKCNTPKHVWFQQQQMLQAQRNDEQMMMQLQYQMEQQQMMRHQMMQQSQMQQLQQQMRQAQMRQQQMRQQQRMRQQQPVQQGDSGQAGSQKAAPLPMSKEAFEKARLLIKRRREQHAEQELRQKHEFSEDVHSGVRVKREGESVHPTEAPMIAHLHPAPPPAVSGAGMANASHEVELAGIRTREERDRELLAAAIDVDCNGNGVAQRKNAISEAGTLPPKGDIEPELSLDGEDDEDILASIGCGD
jgi:hypothetical protein